MSPQNNGVPNTLPVEQPGEHTICTIKRHPIGIFGVYAMCGLALIITAALAFLVVPSMAEDNLRQNVLVGVLIFIVVAALCAVFAGLASRVYWNNIWVLTSDSLTQVNQEGLFNRQSSQLSLAEVEDVTAEQKGILPELFNFGLLQVETASETGKFVFPYCPNPNYYAQQVIAAKEEFEHKRYHNGQAAEVPPPPPQVPSAQPAVLSELAPPIPPPATPVPEPSEPPETPLQQPPPGPNANQDQQNY